uniref:Ig-like domain-containing protein n=1 Tax=Pavo cristatus TaxID=9049 RepID=A0A8C9FW65_PAVCR
ASPSAPRLFPLVPCSPSASSYLVGCAAFDFLPNSVTFSWFDSSNRSVPALDFPSSRISARGFRASSRLQLPQSEGKEKQPFRCRAAHPRGNVEVVLQNPGETRAGGGGGIFAWWPSVVF